MQNNNSNFFNLEMKSRSGENLIVEGVDYKIVKDGNGVERKIINFENPKHCPREGIIELIPLKMSSRHENKVGFRIVTDRVTGIIYGIPTGINAETKQIEWLKINLNDAETFDLTIPLDAMKWTCIKNSFFVEGSPNVKGKAKYKVRDVERAANLFLQGRAQKRKAVDIAEGLMGSQLVEMARNIGIPPEANSSSTLQVAVIEFAEKTPALFMKIWDSPTRKELSVFKKALANGIIIQDSMTGYMYQGNHLGPNEAMAVEFLKEFPNICNTIDVLSQKTETDSVKAMAMQIEKPILDDKDARIAKLESEAAANAELLKRLSAERIMADVAEKGDPIREAWIKEGARLNIKGVHLNKDIEKIKEKVLEKNPKFEV